MDHGSGKRRKGKRLANMTLNEDERMAIVGFHAFTRNDYLPAMFRRGKKRCWDATKKSTMFLNAFKELVRDWELTDEIVTTLEEYVCSLYGSKKNTVNSTRFDMFMKKQNQESKVLFFCVPADKEIKFHCSYAEEDRAISRGHK